MVLHDSSQSNEEYSVEVHPSRHIFIAPEQELIDEEVQEQKYGRQRRQELGAEGKIA